MNHLHHRSVRHAAFIAAVGSACIGAANTAADYSSTVISQDPLFYWRFNETATGALTSQVDNSTTAANAASANTTVLVGQSSGNALTPTGGFAGFETGNTWFSFPATASGDFVASLTNPLGEMSSTIGSVSHWIRTTTGTDGTGVLGTLLRVDQGATGALYTFVGNTGKFGIRISNGSGEATVLADVRSGASYNDGAWHHVAATWDESAGQAILYIDGGLLAGGETVVGSFTDGVDFVSSGRHQFGKGTNNASRYQGSADELAIWAGALTAQQAADQYLAAVPEPASLALISCGALMLVRRGSGGRVVNC